jgi:hypothetical protein
MVLELPGCSIATRLRRASTRVSGAPAHSANNVERACLFKGPMALTHSISALNQSAIDWLLRSDDPAIRFLARRDLLGEVESSLVLLSRMGHGKDPRAEDALERLLSLRLVDGRWRLGGYWWSGSSTGCLHRYAADWGRGGPDEMITLNALRALKASTGGLSSGSA